MQTQFNNAYLALEGATKRLAAAKKQLAKLAKPISVTHEFIWPDSGSATTGTLDTPPELLAVLPTWGGNVDVNNGFYNLAVTLRSSQPGGMGANVGLGMLDHKALARGIPYRSPARGTLAIATAFFDENNKPIEPETVFEKVYMVRQLGRVFQLPCVSKPFTSISCSLAFDAKGQLTKAGTENTKAPLEGAAGLLGSLVESGGSATDSLRAGAEKRAGAATKAKQDELAELELEAKLTAARRAQSSAGGTAAQQAKEAKILEYETDLKLINAQRALAEGQSQVTK